MISARVSLAFAALALCACGDAPAPADGRAETGGEGVADSRPELGLMTSLPIYWPLGAELADLVNEQGHVPPQRAAMETLFTLVPLDTLSPMTPLSPGDADGDPLAGLDRLAVIQPRGLAPADNVALDDWVRSGGRLLLVLDPALTGEYDLPLGDPRRPVGSALIPPVVERWGLGISFDDAQSMEMRNVSLPDGSIPLILSGQISISAAPDAQCKLDHGGVIASCAVGKGRVTLLADAAVFEHPEWGDRSGAGITALLSLALR